MNIQDLHIHIHNSDGREILHELHTLKNLIMKTKEEFQIAIDAVNTALSDNATALDNIAADITRLTEQLQTGGLTDAQEEDIFAQLSAIATRARESADKAKALADVTPETPPTT